MLDRDKNTDNLFRAGLTHFSASPPSSVWTNIENGLEAKKQDKHFFFFWRGLAAASVLLVIGYSLMILFNQTNPETINMVSSIHSASDTINASNSSKIKSEETNNQVRLTQKKVLLSDSTTENQKYPISTAPITKRTTPVDAQGSNQHLAYIAGKGLPLLANNYSCATNQLKSKHRQPLYPTLPVIPTPPSKVRNKRTRILLGGAVSPTYSGNGSNQRQSSGDMYSMANSSNQSSTINEKGLTSISGGLNIRFENDTRWSFETGIHYSKIGETVENDFSYSPNKLSSSANETHILQQISLNNSIGQIHLDNNNLNYTQGNMKEDISNIYAHSLPLENSSAETKQTMEYIEIPLSVRYKIISGFPTVSLSGGISSNFLIGNDVYLSNGKTEIEIGETDNIKPLVFSSSLGLGLELPIGKTFRFSLEPKLKYFLNSVNGDSDHSYKPVSLGIFGGIILIIN
ncbi:MAG: outer membrane beta-barrel protein [Marinilabiliaceae bacterium]|nr:outer membrane beta-barrel protein [Marinilabiliaceae bacterium]